MRARSRRLAREHGRVLFATWHSRFNAAVAEAKREIDALPP